MQILIMIVGFIEIKLYLLDLSGFQNLTGLDLFYVKRDFLLFDQKVST
jgi:hypothetical protein